MTLVGTRAYARGMTIDRQIESDTIFGGLERAEYERLTRELTGYCYRMLGSPFDAEDAVQDTMVRAWREFARFEGRSSLRTWLHRIATNVCIDMLRKRGRRTVPMDLQPPTPAEGAQIPAPLAERTWVLPIPDARLADGEADPAEQVVSRETVRLAFVAALQRLTPRQRAVLILRDVLQFSAAESAELLGTTVASANSALQRARGAVPSITSTAGAPAAGAGADRALPDQALLDEYVAAFEAYDVSRLTALLRSDAVNSMPPLPLWLRGSDQIRVWMLGPGSECRGSRVLPTAANGCAAFAQYRRNLAGGHYPWAIQVVETEGGLITGLHAYVMPELFTFFGFPAALPD
jgi:RNA polymerase sigma-70 factor, ECF subfamily